MLERRDGVKCLAGSVWHSTAHQDPAASSSEKHEYEAGWLAAALVAWFGTGAATYCFRSKSCTTKFAGTPHSVRYMNAQAVCPVSSSRKHHQATAL